MRQRERLRAPDQGRPDVVVTTLSLSHTPFGSPYYYSITVSFDISAEHEPEDIENTLRRFTIEASCNMSPGERRISELDFKAIPPAHRCLHFIQRCFPE